MKKSLLLIVFILILIVLMSGCLPKTPKEITGPTWTSKYTVPLIKKTKDNNNTQIFWGTPPPNEDPTKEQEGLGLEDVDTDLGFSHQGDEPLQVDLLTERITITLEDIGGEVEIIDLPGGFPGGSYPLPEPQTIKISIPELNGYSNVTLSDNSVDYNHIKITLNAPAGDDGFTLELKEGSNSLDTAIFAVGESEGTLSVAGLIIASNADLSIVADGSLSIASGTDRVGFTLDPAPFEVESFTITAETFNTIQDNFGGETVKIVETFDLPENADEFALQLRTAGLTFIPQSLPANLNLSGQLTIEGLNELGLPIEGLYFTRPISLPSIPELQLIGVAEGEEHDLNSILNSEPRPHSLRMTVGSFSANVTPEEELTITYPATISLNYEAKMGLKSLVHTPAKGGEDSGEAKIPDDTPVDFKNAKIFFEINNTSPAGLSLEIWLSPNPINAENPSSDPSAFKNELTISPSSRKTSIISLSEKQFTDLTDPGMVYHQIIITNTSDATPAPGPFTEDHYLEVTVWAQVECLVNKR